MPAAYTLEPLRESEMLPNIGGAGLGKVLLLRAEA